MAAATVTLFLCGDVMLGRGVDRILPHPGDPELREPQIRDAGDYVRLAERANGPIPAPVDPAWPWGAALGELARVGPDARVLNLETSVTRSGDFASGKAVHYRMDPANLDCLCAAEPSACTLANNHVLDFGRAGLAETLDSLSAAGLRAVGAGRGADEAHRPAAVPLAGGGRVLVFSRGTHSSGIPYDWAATPERSGAALAERAESRPVETAGRVTEAIRGTKRPGDIAVVSVHWGSNWGFETAPEETAFAHALIDGGADVVHGHSSHHPRAVGMYRGRLVLYGCGDLVSDYEGIPGYEEYRGDLRLLYFAEVETGSGRLVGLRMVPLRARRMRLEHAGDGDARWLQGALDDAGRGLGCRIRREPDGSLAAVPAAAV
ncbi:CapA family protein [Streptomonospora litoralis]|uniref:Capsule biosynthesis protein CapA n=1 Tax=Streptomonospora litoralis TaxID=2498135 RepID=A0A4P6Q3Y7_9ACTN|nr:CapA family protein [Streptomonospora litoralis]QBI54940.1 Capsule biosynthesis protein CapA [Streptomonospora litoralis]